MNNLKLLFALIVTVTIIEVVSAEIQISPNPIDINLKVNQQGTYNLTIKNNYGFATQDFTFTNLSGFTFPQFNLGINETKIVQFTVLRSTPTQDSILSNIKFNYLVDIPSNPTTYYVNITPQGYSPNFLAIHEQDTVVWKNVDTITHTVTSSFFDYELAPNQSVQRIFGQVGTFNYDNLVLPFGGTIEVLNRSTKQAVHNPNYDTTLRVNLNIIADPTTLQMTNEDESFYSVDSSGSKEGLIKVKNIGNQTAQSVKMSSDRSWITFDVNNFNLEPGEQKFVKYLIEPFILETNETDKNYTTRIKSKASNSEESEISITIYIPYQDIDLDPSNPTKLGDILTRFCREFPEACVPSNGTSGQVIVRDPSFNVTVTQSDWLEILRRQRASEDSQQRLDNKLTLLSDRLDTELPSVTFNSNETLITLKEIERKRQRDKNVMILLAFFVVIVAIVIIIGYRIKRYNTKKAIMEGF